MRTLVLLLLFVSSASPASAQFKAWVLAKLPETPEGLAVDSNGNIYATLLHIGEIVMLKDEGTYDHIAWMPSKEESGSLPRRHRHPLFPVQPEAQPKGAKRGIALTQPSVEDVASRQMRAAAPAGLKHGEYVGQSKKIAYPWSQIHQLQFAARAL
jgi:hypothetical protein